MARRHWLDPLARKVLQAMGDLPKDPVRVDTSPAPAEETTVAPSWSIDVNRATAEQWRQLPGCSEVMVDQLLDISETLCEQWRPHLIFRWHGDAPQLPEQSPLDLNAASSTLLAKSLPWPDERLERLIAERRREPFQNLADLQERLCLPPATVEALIGRVRFGARPAGPSLPPRG